MPLLVQFHLSYEASWHHSLGAGQEEAFDARDPPERGPDPDPPGGDGCATLRDAAPRCLEVS